MQKRLFQLLSLAASLTATGVAIVLFAPGPADSAPTRPTATAHALPVTTLPTIEVRADAHVPVLPTVTIRPERAVPTTMAAHAAVSADTALALLATGSTTGTSFDMPYYSFGQTQRRVSKE